MQHLSQTPDRTGNWPGWRWGDNKWEHLEQNLPSCLVVLQEPPCSPPDSQAAAKQIGVWSFLLTVCSGSFLLP